jgi:hypothetical protein
VPAGAKVDGKILAGVLSDIANVFRKSSNIDAGKDAFFYLFCFLTGIYY